MSTREPRLISLASIQQAAVSTFSQRGYAATGIREIAAAAGVTSGTLYLYAPSKLAILELIMDCALDELLRVAELAAGQGRSPAERLEGLVRAHVAVQATNPRTAQVVDGELRTLAGENREAIIGKRDAYERYWTDVLASGARDGAFVLDDLPITRLALLEMCNGVTHWYQPDGSLSLERIQEIFVRLSFNLVRHTGKPQGDNPRLRPRRLACEPLAADGLVRR